MTKKIVIFPILILSIILLLVVFKKNEHNELLANRIQMNKQPQEYMKNVDATLFDEQGELKNELSAEYWAYLPTTGNSILKLPHLTVHKPNHAIWIVDAKQGKIKQPTLGNLENILLQEKVVVQRKETAGFIPMILETEELKYQPKEQYAETQQFVNITKPGLKITGIGLRAFLNEGRVELLNDVKTYYTTTH